MANRYKVANRFCSITTIAFSSFVTFIGFSGHANINTWALALFDVTFKADAITATMNLMIFLLFLVSIIQLAFSFQRRETDSEKAVVSLSTFINEIDDIESVANDDVTPDAGDLIREKYAVLQTCIPANSDRDYRKAKGIISSKNAIGGVSEHLIERNLSKKFDSIIRGSIHTKDLLEVIRSEKTKDLYLCGGQVRNAIWDSLSGHVSNFSGDDVDVIYYDDKDISEQAETAVAERLKEKRPNLRWTVKNQARMAAHNGDNKYSNIKEAILAFPDTSSAIAIKLNAFGSLCMIAPYGLRPLFSMIVTPTPHIIKCGNLERYSKRIMEKRWSERWSNLQIVDL